jgi:hypothetical protein
MPFARKSRGNMRRRYWTKAKNTGNVSFSYLFSD